MWDSTSTYPCICSISMILLSILYVRFRNLRNRRNRYDKAYSFQFSMWDSKALLGNRGTRLRGLSILYVRFLLYSSVEPNRPDYAFNSLCEILGVWSVSSVSNTASFNSLCEIRCGWGVSLASALIKLSILYVRFEELKEKLRQMGEQLSILYVRFNSMINTQTRIIPHFQFSMWDSEGWGARYLHS